MRFRYLALLAVACGIACTNVASAQVAQDDASQPAYADGWQAGDNGGIGFLPWTFAYSGVAPTFHSDHFIDAVPLPANTLGAPTFGMTDSGRPFFFDTSESVRPFASPVAAGQTVEVDIDGAGFANGDPNGFSAGNVVALRNGAGVERLGLFTNNQFNGDNWSVTNPLGAGAVVNTGIAAGSSFHVNFTLLAAEAYNLVLTPVGGGAPLFAQAGLLSTASVGTQISQLRFADYGTGSAADGSSELFFDNLRITNIPEPSSVALAIGAIIALGSTRRRING